MKKHSMIKFALSMLIVTVLLSFLLQTKKVVKVYINKNNTGFYYIRTKFSPDKVFNNKYIYQICDTNLLILDCSFNDVSRIEIYDCKNQKNIQGEMKMPSEFSLNPNKAFFIFYNPPTKYFNDTFYLRSNNYKNRFLDSINLLNEKEIDILNKIISN